MADAALESSTDELEVALESPDEFVSSSVVVVVESSVVVLESPEELIVVEVAAACWLDDEDAVVPIEPSYAMAPKATANVARAAATTRRRRRPMRAARAASFCLARSAGEGGWADMPGSSAPFHRAGWGAPEG